MKASKFLFYTGLIFLLISCSKDQDDQFSAGKLLGDWQLTKAEVNGFEKPEVVERGVWLGFQDGTSFYHNYIHGIWSRQKNRIILDMNTDVGKFHREYQILELSDAILKVKTVLVESRYFGDFIEFESDEILTIVETYNKR